MGIPEVKLSENLGRKILEKNRLGYTFCSLTAGSVVGFHKPSLVNIVRALEERVFRVKDDLGNFVTPPQPVPRSFRDVEMTLFRRRYIDFVGQLSPHALVDVLACYKGKKKAAYQRAMLTMHLPITPKDARISAFVKVEKLDLGLKADPCPRLIQPRSKRYNLRLGQYLRLNEKYLTKSIDRVFGETTVLSGYDSFTQGKIIHSKWKKYSNPIAIGLDASRFDQHTSVQALKFEHSCWNGIFGDPHLASILKMQLYNKGSAYTEHGRVSYKTNGCRMSGDINTSLGNKLIMCAMVWSYLAKFQIKASLVNNGDDCVLICDKNQLELIQSTLGEYFLGKGYKMVVEKPVDFIEGIEFCRSRPVRVGNSYHMVRGISSLSRDCTTLLRVDREEEMRCMLTAVGYCGLVINSGIPVHSGLHRRMYELGGKDVTESMISQYSSYENVERMGRLKLVDRAVSDQSRLSYFRAFGIEPHRQLLLERYYASAEVAAETTDIKVLPLLHSILHANNFASLA